MGQSQKEEYTKVVKEYKLWCKKENEKHAKKEEDRIKEIKSEAEAWKFINKFRKRREKTDEGIEIEKWGKHFMNLLGKKEERICLEIEDRLEEDRTQQQRTGRDWENGVEAADKAEEG